MVILSAGDWVCIFVLFAVWMKLPAQGTTGDWMMPGLVFKRFPLCDFSLFDNPYGCRLWGRTESDTTEVMQQQQQQQHG